MTWHDIISSALISLTHEAMDELQRSARKTKRALCGLHVGLNDLQLFPEQESFSVEECLHSVRS